MPPRGSVADKGSFFNSIRNEEQQLASSFEARFASLQLSSSGGEAEKDVSQAEEETQAKEAALALEAEEARQKAEEERQRAEDERQKAEEARQRAEDERQKAEEEIRAKEEALKLEEERRKAEEESLAREAAQKASEKPSDAEARSKSGYAVVCAWALGGDESNFAEMMDEFSSCKDVTFVFVTPPREDEWYRYVSGTMASLHHQDCQKINEEDFQESSKALQAEVQKQAERLGGYERVFILSYSQGGTIAMDAAMELNKPLGGVLLLRTTVMATTFANFAARKQIPKAFPVLVTGARRANRVYTMEETDRIFLSLCEQGWNARYHVFSVGHGAEWSEEELAYINGHMRSWMGKSPGWAPWKHALEDWGPAWAAKPKHGPTKEKCPVCQSKVKGAAAPPEEEDADELPLKPKRRLVGKTNVSASISASVSASASRSGAGKSGGYKSSS